MEQLLAVLQGYVNCVKVECAVISQNYAATNAMAEDILDAIEHSDGKQEQPRIGHPGERYGRLTLISFSGRIHQTELWLCKCDCGVERSFRLGNLRTRMTRSCGCLQRRASAMRTRQHGEARHGKNTAEYRCWTHVIGRCNNPKDASYKNYGGRGIMICPQWAESYETFLRDMGRKPSPDHSIERNNNDGNYEPGNCCWALRPQQRRNTRRVIWVEINGERMVAKDAARKYGVPYSRLYQRLVRGVSIEDAIAMPPQNQNARRNKCH